MIVYVCWDRRRKKKINTFFLTPDPLLFELFSTRIEKKDNKYIDLLLALAVSRICVCVCVCVGVCVRLFFDVEY